MIFYLNLLLFCVTAASAWWLGINWLLVLLIFGAALCLLGFKHREQRVLSTWRGLLVKSHDCSQFVLPGIEEVSRLLVLRLNNLQAELDYCAQRSSSPAKENLAQALQTAGDTLSSELSLLVSMRNQFRATLRALALSDRQSEQLRLFVDDPRGERLSTYLRLALADLIATADGLFNTSIETASASSSVRALEAFEISHLLLLPFNIPSGTGYLVLAYSHNTEPLQSEIRAAQEHARYLGGVLGSRRKVAELTSAIAEIRESDRRKGEFMAQVSHDIRSPLNNIQSILSLIRVEGLGLEGFEMIDVALKNCRDVADLLRDILDFARHQSGKLVAHRVVLDLAEVLRDVSNSFELMFKSKGIKLLVQIPAGRSLCLADPRHVRRVLSNLLANALSYTKQGEVRISIDSDRSTFRVKDTGIGMTPAQVAGLFVPFCPASQSHSSCGVGLGLALSKVLCELNFASISVRSEIGLGSEFIVALEAASARALPPGANSCGNLL